MRIFEARYLDMVSDCLRNDRGFGICLIESGEEVGPAPQIHRFGTLVNIVDWNRREDGLLGIVVRGKQPIRVLDYTVQGDGLLMADMELLEPEGDQPISDQYIALAELLHRLIAQLGEPYHRLLDGPYDDASWVGARLTELLPLPASSRQRLYEFEDPVRRLEALQNALRLGLI